MSIEREGNTLTIKDVDGDFLDVRPASFNRNLIWVETNSVLITPDDAESLAEHLVVLARRARRFSVNHGHTGGTCDPAGGCA